MIHVQVDIGAVSLSPEQRPDAWLRQGIKVADDCERFPMALPTGLDAPRQDLKMRAAGRALRLDEPAIDADRWPIGGRWCGGRLRDFATDLGIDRFADRQGPIACGDVIEAVALRQALPQQFGRLSIWQPSGERDLEVPEFGRRPIRQQLRDGTERPWRLSTSR